MKREIDGGLRDGWQLATMKRLYFVRQMQSIDEDIQGPPAKQKEKEWERYKDINKVKWCLANGQPVSGFCFGKYSLAVEINGKSHRVKPSQPTRTAYCNMGWFYRTYFVEEEEFGNMGAHKITRKILLLPKLNVDGTEKKESGHCVIDLEWLRLDGTGEFVLY